MSNRPNRTHIEHVKNPDKILLPTRNLVLITLRMDEPGEWIPFIVLDYLPLNLGHSSTVEDISEWITRYVHYWSGSRSKMSNCVEEGLTELVQSSALQFPVEDLAHIAARPPKVDVILVVGHRVLDDGNWSSSSHSTEVKLT